jgi:chromate transporter
MRALAALFLRLGLTAFGGPAAHIAMMRDEVVTRRQWLTSEEFLDLLGATNLIPGPNSTELAIHIGNQRAGWKGLVVAGTCFIVPAALITFAMAWAYVRFGSLPETRGILYGVKPVIISVVLQALWMLGKTSLKTRLLAAIGGACVIARVADVNELLLLLAAGAVVALARTRSGGKRSSPPNLAIASTPLAMGAGSGAVAVAFSPLKLFLVFFKIGSVLFGSGYVLLAFLRADLVERLQWLTEQQLIDAVAVGQLTPGPVLSTATFVGYVVGGGSGAALATVGIFLPSFFFVAASGLVLPRLRRSEVARAFLDGVNVASLALMAVVTWDLGRAALVDGWSLALAAASGVALFRFKINSAWLVLAGGAAGFLLSRV